MTGAITMILEMLLNFLSFVAKLGLYALAPTVGATVLWWLYYRYVKRLKPIKKITNWHKPGLLYRIFFRFPQQLAHDLITRDPNKFGYYGSRYFCGAQGCGKTVAMVYYLRKIQKQYPMSKAFANFHVEGVPLFNGWKEIVDNNNGEYGVVFAIDEITIWFNNKDSRDFPPEFIQDLNQQRKQRKTVIGTAQRFGQMAKDLRSLPDFVFLPHTLFGCLTVVFVTRPELWDNEKNRFKKYQLGLTWFFVHDKELRDCFDTYERVQRAARDGFAPNVFLERSSRSEHAQDS